MDGGVAIFKLMWRYWLNFMKTIFVLSHTRFFHYDVFLIIEGVVHDF